MFSNLRQNQTIYIIDLSNEPAMKIGTVANIIQPASPIYQPLNLPNDGPIDIKVKYEDDTIVDFPKLQPSQCTATYNGGKVIVCDSRETASQEVENLHSISQKNIDNVPYHEKMLGLTDKWMQILNPRYAKEKETDDEIKALKNNLQGVNGKLDNLAEMMQNYFASSSSGRSKSNN